MTSTALKDRLLSTSERIIDSQRDRWESDRKAAPQPNDDLEYMWQYERDNRLCMAEARIDNWMKRVPPLYQSANLDTLTPEQHPDQLRAYLDSTVRNLMLAGPVGTGKTYAAWALAHEAVAQGYRASAWSVPRLMVDMRPDGHASTFRHACEIPLLILDDLGAARPTDWAVEQMFSIADERTSYQRRTILTTNATYDGLVAFWGQPTMDRFRDNATHVVMAGPSRRGVTA